MPTITLHATGDVTGGLGTPAVVGSAPQWGDGSDSTYATAASSSTYMVSAMETLTLPAGATVTAVRARVRAVAGGANTLGDFSLNSDSGFGTGFACYFDPTGSGINTTLTGSAADYDLLRSSHSLSQDPVTVLSAGAWVGAKLDGATAGSLTVYEFSVFVDYTGSAPTFAPPQRLTNRDDMYASARRLTGSTSRQGSNRLTGYL